MTHVRRITYSIDEELPIKNENCCWNSSEQNMFDSTHETSIAFTPFLERRGPHGVTRELFQRFQDKVVLCNSVVSAMKPCDRKDYLASRVTKWKQKIEHIEKIIDTLPKEGSEKKLFTNVTRYTLEN